MNFLKTLFWVVLAVIVVLFASRNWTTVTLDLWGGLQADVKLPVLVLAAFLIGFLPPFLYYRARIWSLHRRLSNYERQVAEVQRPASPAEAPAGTAAETLAPPAPPPPPSATTAPHPTASDIGPSV
jgi:putative membrane protein